MQQERHQVEGRVLEGWPRFLHSQSLRKREGKREKVPLPFARRHSVDEVVEGKRNSVYLARVGMRGFERTRHGMVEKTWPRLWQGARSLRSAIKERGMGVPGFGESHAYIRDEDAEQFPRYLYGSALLLVSYHSSLVVHLDKLNHHEHPLLYHKPDSGDLTVFVMPNEMPLCQVQRLCRASPCGTLAPPL